MNKTFIGLVVFIGVLVLTGAVVYQSINQPDNQVVQEAFTTPPCRNFSEGTLQLTATTISIAVADTREERSRGLSGCESIPVNLGMYFIFEDTQEVAFWMKHMLIPIDIVWIKDGIVVGIESNVQPPADISVPDSELPQYPSPGVVDAVLELGANQAMTLELEIGHTVTRL